MTAIITGYTGQDGYYLSELLLEKGYHLKCLCRQKIEHDNPMIQIYHGDVNSRDIIDEIINDCEHFEKVEIYNLAGCSQYDIYTGNPESSFKTNTIGILNILESVRQSKNPNKFRIFQASSSEMFGTIEEYPQNELTTFKPKTIYGVSKLSGHWLVKNYRDTYGLHASSGILYNHESPKRGEYFVTKKIVETLKRIFKGEDCVLKLGNINTQKDWGHAQDFVQAMWLMLQQDEPDDYIIATGKCFTVKEFIEFACKQMGKNITWEDSKGLVDDNVVVEISSEFYRPSSNVCIVGDTSKLRNIGWVPKHNIHTLIHDMIDPK
jgi:GDPmannose 4,6-dehydratase